MAAQKRAGELPENYEKLRHLVLSSDATTLNILVGHHIFGLTETKKLAALPSYAVFNRVMEIVSLLRTIIPAQFMWPMCLYENLRQVPKSRSFIGGFGIQAYEIECGPHGGTPEDEALWWETEAKAKAVAYGSTPEVALLRASILLAGQHSFVKSFQSVS